MEYQFIFKNLVRSSHNDLKSQYASQEYHGRSFSFSFSWFDFFKKKEQKI